MLELVLQLVRDPVWQFIGALIAGIALILTLIEIRRKYPKEQAAAPQQRTSNSASMRLEGVEGVDIASQEQTAGPQRPTVGAPAMPPEDMEGPHRAQVVYPRHKKRKHDGILFANVSSDYLNQFPVSMGTLQNHLDRQYTPEDFGHTTWLAVFQRLIKEGYFVPAEETAVSQVSYRTMLNPGPKLKRWLADAARLRRSIMGLDDDAEPT